MAKSYKKLKYLATFQAESADKTQPLWYQSVHLNGNMRTSATFCMAHKIG